MAVIEIVEHSGRARRTTVDNYDPIEIFEMLLNARNGNNPMVIIGRIIIDARTIQSVNEIEEEPKEEPQEEAPAEPEEPTEEEPIEG